MKKARPIVAICYDFDGTLSPRNMQEYGFFSSLDRDVAKNFWSESRDLSKKNGADPILAYMHLMLKRAAEDGAVGTTKVAFREFGKSVQFFPGVDGWFKRINDCGKDIGLKVEHYIVSSGLKEMIEGTTISKYFKKIYACSFVYDHNGCAEWPAVAVNYTTKTQFLFRINKGVEDDTDDRSVNAFILEKDRRIPFARMIYIGDGATDIPCMRLVKEKRGTSIAVYPPKSRKKHQETESLVSESRVNYVAVADYSEGKQLDAIVKAVLNKVSADVQLQKYLPKQVEKAKKQADTKDGSAKGNDESAAISNGVDVVGV